MRCVAGRVREVRRVGRRVSTRVMRREPHRALPHRNTPRADGRDGMVSGKHRDKPPRARVRSSDVEWNDPSSEGEKRRGGWNETYRRDLEARSVVGVVPKHGHAVAVSAGTRHRPAAAAAATPGSPASNSTCARAHVRKTRNGGGEKGKGVRSVVSQVSVRDAAAASGKKKKKKKKKSDATASRGRCTGEPMDGHHVWGKIRRQRERLRDVMKGVCFHEPVPRDFPFLVRAHGWSRLQIAVKRRGAPTARKKKRKKP